MAFVLGQSRLNEWCINMRLNQPIWLITTHEEKELSQQNAQSRYHIWSSVKRKIVTFAYASIHNCWIKLWDGNTSQCQRWSTSYPNYQTCPPACTLRAMWTRPRRICFANNTSHLASQYRFVSCGWYLVWKLILYLCLSWWVEGAEIFSEALQLCAACLSYT